MMNHPPIVWTALITPMHEGGQVDIDSLQRCAQRQAEAGNAILLVGSTGEGLALDKAEKHVVVETVVAMQLDVPIMVGVGGHQLSEQLQWVESCNALPIDAYLLLTPLYAKPGRKGQALWFRALLDAAEHPCMLYNVPSRTGCALHPAVLSDLAGHANLWALKEASGSVQDFVQYRQANPDISLFSGEDGLMLDLAQAGAQGLVSVISNVWPEATSRYVQQCLANSLSQADRQMWQRATAALFSTSNPIPAKAILAEQGVIKSSFCRLPLLAEDLEDLVQLKQADQEVSAWR